MDWRIAIIVGMFSWTRSHSVRRGSPDARDVMLGTSRDTDNGGEIDE